MKRQSTRKTRHKRIKAAIKIILIACAFPVFRSNKYVFAQIIDDVKRTTLVSAGDFKSKGKNKKTESAKDVGLELLKPQVEKIELVVSDRGGYKYQGRVKALAEDVERRRA